MKRSNYKLRFDRLESRDLPTLALVPIPTQFVQENSVLAVQAHVITPEFQPVYSLVDPPPGATIDPGTGLVLFRPPPVQAYYQFAVQAVSASDPTLVASTPLDVYVFDNPPLISAGVNTVIPVNTVLSRTGTFADPDPDTWSGVIDYGDGTSPQALAITGHEFGMSHEYVSPGNYIVAITITDSQGFQGRAFFGVTVTQDQPSGVPSVPSVPGVPGVPVATHDNLSPMNRFLAKHHDHRRKVGLPGRHRQPGHPPGAAFPGP